MKRELPKDGPHAERPLSDRRSGSPASTSLRHRLDELGNPKPIWNRRRQAQSEYHDEIVDQAEEAQ